MDINVRARIAEVFGIRDDDTSANPDPDREYGPRLLYYAQLLQAITAFQATFSKSIAPSVTLQWKDAHQRFAVPALETSIQDVLGAGYTLEVTTASYTPIVDSKGRTVGHISTHCLLNGGKPHETDIKGSDRKLHSYVDLITGI